MAGALLFASMTHAEAELVSAIIWEGDSPHFGGFSAIHVDDDGLGFVALSDRAALVEGRFLRDAQGVIVGAEAGSPMLLRDRDGAPLRGPLADSEGIAVGPDGRLYIAFEGRARVRVQDGATGRPRLLPRHPDFDAMAPNASLEALAIAPDGTLYAIPERSGRANRPFPVYRYRNGAWDIPFALPRLGSFLVSGADIGPDGMLYVLERDFAVLGFRSRVRRFARDGSGETVLLETRTGAHDNLEGLSVWRDAAGDIRITMIADDNFGAFQRNEIVEYRIAP